MKSNVSQMAKNVQEVEERLLPATQEIKIVAWNMQKDAAELK